MIILNNGDNMNFLNYTEIIIKSIATFFILLLLAKLLGKKQLSQLTYFNYVTGITIGSIAANVMNVVGDTAIDELIALITWGILTYLTGFITTKSHKLEKIIDGEPNILIKNGKIQMAALKKIRMNITELVMMLREKDIFNINEVDYAILEINGKLSVLKKVKYRNVTNNDLNIPITKPQIYANTSYFRWAFNFKNLKEVGISKMWLLKELRKKNIKKISNVIYAEITNDGSLFVDTK